jgi:hypothetical protein
MFTHTNYYCISEVGHKGYLFPGQHLILHIVVLMYIVSSFTLSLSVSLRMFTQCKWLFCNCLRGYSVVNNTGLQYAYRYEFLPQYIMDYRLRM